MQADGGDNDYTLMLRIQTKLFYAEDYKTHNSNSLPHVQAVLFSSVAQSLIQALTGFPAACVSIGARLH